LIRRHRSPRCRPRAATGPPDTDHSRGFATMGKLFKIVLPVAIVAGLASVLLKKRKQA
jgi:hypothetical protein